MSAKKLLSLTATILLIIAFVIAIVSLFIGLGCLINASVEEEVATGVMVIAVSIISFMVAMVVPAILMGLRAIIVQLEVHNGIMSKEQFYKEECSTSELEEFKKSN